MSNVNMALGEFEMPPENFCVHGAQYHSRALDRNKTGTERFAMRF
jgi:hypothetical protein